MIGLLVWLHLLAQMTLYAAEINVVVIRRLWPRSLLGPPEAPADQETLRALAKVEERHDVEQVDVHFHNGEPASHPAASPASRDGRAVGPRTAGRPPPAASSRAATSTARPRPGSRRTRRDAARR